MQLKPNCDSDRAWVWSVPADFADETPKSELLAVRFANSESEYCLNAWALPVFHFANVCLLANM